MNKKLLYNPAYVFIINELKTQRKKLNLKQSELGELIKRDQKFVSRIEAFTKEIDIDELYIMCEALDISFLKLIAKFSYQMKLQNSPDNIE